MPSRDMWRSLRQSGLMTLQVAVIFIILFALIETALRTPQAQVKLGPPGMGISTRDFELRWHEFVTYAQDREVLDCVVLGDSTVMSDFFPVAFSDAYRNATGETMECFNFGAGGFTVVDYAALAEIIVAHYSPHLIMVGVEPLNFSIASDAEETVNFGKKPWVNYQRGDISIKGWLLENSYFYRYSELIEQLVKFEKSFSDVQDPAFRTSDLLREGYYPLIDPSPFVIANPPDPESDHPYPEFYFSVLQQFAIYPEQLDAFETILKLQGDSTNLVIVEMPLAPNFQYFFGHGEQDYQYFMEVIQSSVSLHGIQFVPDLCHDLKAPEMWFNYNHLNSAGAAVFSNCLGRIIGETVSVDL